MEDNYYCNCAVCKYRTKCLRYSDMHPEYLKEHNFIKDVINNAVNNAINNILDENPEYFY